MKLSHWVVSGIALTATTALLVLNTTVFAPRQETVLEKTEKTLQSALTEQQETETRFFLEKTKLVELQTLNRELDETLTSTEGFIK